MSVTFAQGFSAAGVEAGISAVEGKKDLALVVNNGPLDMAAGVFTSNRFCAAPVQWTRKIVADGHVKAVILNSGGANACTGQPGYEQSKATAQKVAALVGAKDSDIAVCSTGLIGELLPLDHVLSGADKAFAALADTAQAGADASHAIMTTDTKPKTVELEGSNGFHSLKYFKIGGGIARGVVAIGIPASLNNILMSFANIVLNQALVGYGDTPVAAMGVAMKSNMLVVLLQIGLCVGIQPLIGYNYGAGNKKRLMQVFKFTGIVSVVMGTILTLLMMAARKTLVQVFINDAQVIAYGIQMVIALQLSAPFLGILFLCINTIQGMGKAIPSLVLTVCRQGLIFIPLIFILNHMFGLEGVIYAQPAADYLSIVVAILICTHLFRNMEHRNESVEE